MRACRTRARDTRRSPAPSRPRTPSRLAPRPCYNGSVSATRGPEVVIVGAGPAGMMLAYQLVSNGVRVHVIERHPDFRREFRGELVMPSVLEPLETLGILPALVERGGARRDVERQMFVGLTRRVSVPGGKQIGAWIAQPAFLELLHEACSRYPHYRLDFGTTAVRSVQLAGKVVAIATRSKGGEGRVEGEVFVVCNGRGTGLRKELGAEVESQQMPANVLWLRLDFSDAPELLPDAVQVHMWGHGGVVVFFRTSESRLQIAYSAPGDLGDLRKDVGQLRRLLLPKVPERMRAKVEAGLVDGVESQILHVSVDQLKRWHAGGALFLGDAAHTMSPMAGQGLNVAIRDAIVTANHLLAAIDGAQRIDDALFERIEAERRPEIDAIQALQVRVHRMVMVPRWVEHVMFTMMGVALLFARNRPAGVAQGVLPVQARHAIPLAQAGSNAADRSP